MVEKLKLDFHPLTQISRLGCKCSSDEVTAMHSHKKEVYYD